jgi:hypothetical protein
MVSSSFTGTSTPSLDDYSGSAISQEPFEARVIPPDKGADAGADRPLCQCPAATRNLVVCIDGTANQFGMKVRLPLYLSLFFT